jgi:hypothetical protein
MGIRNIQKITFLRVAFALTFWSLVLLAGSGSAWQLKETSFNKPVVYPFYIIYRYTLIPFLLVTVIVYWSIVRRNRVQGEVKRVRRALHALFLFAILTALFSSLLFWFYDIQVRDTIFYSDHTYHVHLVADEAFAEPPGFEIWYYTVHECDSLSLICFFKDSYGSYKGTEEIRFLNDSESGSLKLKIGDDFFEVTK